MINRGDDAAGKTGSHRAREASSPLPDNPDYPEHGNPEFNPAWEVMRDSGGQPVTLTWEQVEAVWRAFSVWNAVVNQEQAERKPDQRQNWIATNPANWMKSRLLGRMLVDGKPPTRTRPPVVAAEPRWDLLPGGDPFGPGAPDV